MKIKTSFYAFLIVRAGACAWSLPLQIWPEEDQGIIENCYLLNDADEWTPANNPLNRFSAICKNLKMHKLCPVHSFSQTRHCAGGKKSAKMLRNAVNF